MDGEKVRDLKDILCAIRDFEAELNYYHSYEPEDKESIARLEKKVKLEEIKYDELLPSYLNVTFNEPIDAKMELYDEIGVPSSGIADEYPIVTKMCEDLLKQTRKSND